MIRKTSTLVVLVALSLTSCAAPSKPKPPKKLCGVATPSREVSALIPSGEKITFEREEEGARALQHNCSVSVDERYIFDVRHDPDGQHYAMRASAGESSRFPPRTFQGKALVQDTQATAVAECNEKENPVYGYVSTDTEAGGRTDKKNRQLLKEFINAYMPRVQEFYDCEG